VYLNEKGEIVAQLVEFVENLLLDEWLMQFVDLGLQVRTLMTCFFDIFFIANLSAFLVASVTSPKAPYPNFFTTS